mmetsp:Transcript_4301/g.9308  ORF Transcript_4301/g.9308 Transcript_4301/m.9308 type:complete len:106 (+) Transcript_4301:1030-1347(+)
MMASLILVDYMFFEVSPPHVFDLRVSCLAFLECPALFVAGCGCAQQDNGMCKYRNGKCEITLFDYYCAGFLCPVNVTIPPRQSPGGFELCCGGGGAVETSHDVSR